MKAKKRVMQFIVIGTLVLALLVHGLSNYTHGSMHHDTMTASSPTSSFLLHLLFWLPVALVSLSVVLYGFHKDHAWIPFLHAMSLTFSSFSIIAGGHGMVEYHFSIFMVLAILMYYDNIKLLLISTVLFAAQHLLGYLFFPELVYGSNVYAFSMVAIHLVFVILFIGAVIYQIVSNRRATRAFEIAQNDKLQQTVKAIIERLSDTSQEVRMNSNGLSVQSSELNRLTSEVVQTMHKVEQAAINQEQGVEVSRHAVTEMLKETSLIAENSSNVSDISNQAAQEAERGNDLIQLAVHQMKSMNSTIHTTAEKVKVLGERSEEINQIVNLITDIASRTNLLALNAAIEAARAGEHGKGFTIVASEVRKLAEQTSSSAKQIADLIQDVQSNNQASIDSMDRVIVTFEHGNDAVVAAGHAFEHILKAVHSIALQMRDINGASQQVSASTQQFSVTMEEISHLSTQLAKNVKSVSKRTDQQDQLICKTSQLADLLGALSDKLNDIMKTTEQSFSQT
jgi:methyl-accepting chemotaxis protein